MSFDISWHPIDEVTLAGVVLPYLRGEANATVSAEEFLLTARQHAKVRAYIKRVEHQFSLVHQPHPNQRKQRPTSLSNKYSETQQNANYLQGRPYLLMGNQLVELVDQYVHFRTLHKIDEAQNFLFRILAEVPYQLDIQNLTVSNVLALSDVIADLEFLRIHYPALARNESLKMPDGEIASAEDLYLFTMPMVVVKLLESVTPGWMARGPVWFTQYLEDAQLNAFDMVTSTASLFDPVLKSIDGYETAFTPTITQNYMLGGYIRAADVPRFVRLWQEHEEALIAPWIADNDEARGRHGYRCILEAAMASERLGFGFLEATEVYSRFLGILN